MAMRYYLGCLACRKTSSLKRMGSTDVYLDRGIDKLSRDLDIVNLLDLIKGYRVMKQVLFSQQDRFLLQMQRRDVIYSSSSEEQNEQELLVRNK